MAFDKFDYHCGADDFPRGVPAKNGGTQIGMFIDWARKRGLLNERLHLFSPTGAWLLRRGIVSGRMFAGLFCDWSFSSGDHLNERGHAFAEAYYDHYLNDYEALFAGRYETPYHVRYSRANRKRVAELLDRQYAAWQSGLGQ